MEGTGIVRYLAPGFQSSAAVCVPTSRVRRCADISFMGIGVEGAIASDFRGLTFTCGNKADEDAGICVPKSGSQALEELGMEDTDVWEGIWTLFYHTVIYRFLAWLALHFFWTGETFNERWQKFIGKR